MTVEFIHGDSLELLRQVPDESVDLVFCDPPFNVGLRYDDYEDRMEGYYLWCWMWIQQCFRVLKPTGSFYLMTIPRHVYEMYSEMKRHGAWINNICWKNNASVNNRKSFWNSYQPILLFGKTKDYKFNTYAQRDKRSQRGWAKDYGESQGQLKDFWDDIPLVWAGASHHPEAILEPGTNRKAHPAQMPVALAERAILFSTDEGDKVLDPFCGSGTVGVACYKHRRNFVGFDQSQKYIDLCQERLRLLELQPELSP
jgi:DNA modification methylase